MPYPLPFALCPLPLAGAPILRAGLLLAVHVVTRGAGVGKGAADLDNRVHVLLLRGLGPSLADFNLPGVLQDPTLELHDASGALIVTNDNWRDLQEAEIIATTIPPGDDREAAIVATLDPGNYTAIVQGKSNTTGTALVEAYDLDLTPDSRFGNISTRGLVGTDTDVLIGGLIVSSEE